MSAPNGIGMEVTRVIPPQDMQVIRRDEAFMPIMNIARAVERYNALVEFTQQIMKDGKDFGTVPGTDKPTLLKPGAEKLCNFFGLSPKFTIIEKVERWDGDEPLFYYVYKCQLYRGETLLGEGDGSCNSRESKYRYRWVGESQLPKGSDKSRYEARDGSVTEMDFAIQKAETTGKYGKPSSYWQAFKDAVANGTAERTTKEIKNGEKKPAWKISAPVFRVPNPDICDQVNTIQKMAQKRSFIAASLIACNASEYYTQDMEDLAVIDEGPLPDTGGHPLGTQAAADHVGKKKVEEMKAARSAQPANGNDPRTDTVRVKSPEGEFGTVARSKLQDFLADGFVEAPLDDPAPKPQSSPAPSRPEDAPSDVQKMWAQMTDIKSTLAVFSNLKRSLCEALGTESGERMYYATLGKNGVEHANQFKSTKPARATARDLLVIIQDAQKPPVAGNEDLPEGLGL